MSSRDTSSNRDIPLSSREIEKLRNVFVAVAEKVDRDLAVTLKRIDDVDGISHVNRVTGRRISTLVLPLHTFFRQFEQDHGYVPDYRLGTLLGLVGEASARCGRKVGIRFRSSTYVVHVDPDAVLLMEVLAHYCPSDLLVVTAGSAPEKKSGTVRCVVELYKFSTLVKLVRKDVVDVPAGEFLKIPIHVPISFFGAKGLYELLKYSPDILLGEAYSEEELEEFKKRFPKIDPLVEILSKHIETSTQYCGGALEERTGETEEEEDH